MKVQCYTGTCIIIISATVFRISVFSCTHRKTETKSNWKLEENKTYQLWKENFTFPQHISNSYMLKHLAQLWQKTMRHLPQAPLKRTEMRFCCEQLATTRWHSLEYVTPSVPHTGANTLVHVSMHRHLPSPAFLSTTHRAPKAQNVRAHGAGKSRECQ